MKTQSQQLPGFARILAGWMILVLLLATAGSVSALSTVDTIHTGVGLIVVQFPDGNLWAGDAHGITCSGILIAPKVFLTAGHCTRGLQAWLDQGFITAVYVTFETQFTPDAPLVQVNGIVTYPFSSMGSNDPHDLGVLLLDTPVTDRSSTPLPAVGLLDELHLSPHTLVTSVGYGMDTNNVHGHPTYINTLTRSTGTLAYQSITLAYVNVSMLANQGYDNICFGDSGGPDFVQVNGAEQLIAINMSVNSAGCEQQGTLYRLDTPSAREFLSQFVTLP
jgi:trypsin